MDSVCVTEEIWFISVTFLATGNNVRGLPVTQCPPMHMRTHARTNKSCVLALPPCPVCTSAMHLLSHDGARLHPAITAKTYTACTADVTAFTIFSSACEGATEDSWLR